MAVITWGKPEVEIGITADGSTATTFTELPEIKEDTALLTTEKGAKQEAIAEGGELVDVRYKKNKYTFTCDIFLKKGDTKPIVDADGVVSEKYSVRLTPEDDTLQGWVMDNTSVSVEESWSSAEGTLWKYTFEGIKPNTGNMLKPYTKV